MVNVTVNVSKDSVHLWSLPHRLYTVATALASKLEAREAHLIDVAADRRSSVSRGPGMLFDATVACGNGGDMSPCDHSAADALRSILVESAATQGFCKYIEPLFQMHSGASKAYIHPPNGNLLLFCDFMFLSENSCLFLLVRRTNRLFYLGTGLCYRYT